MSVRSPPKGFSPKYNDLRIEELNAAIACYGRGRIKVVRVCGGLKANLVKLFYKLDNHDGI